MIFTNIQIIHISDINEQMNTKIQHSIQIHMVYGHVLCVLDTEQSR